jgi:hypothetical protein
VEENRYQPAGEMCFNVVIKVYDSRYGNGREIERREWKMLRLQMVVKYSLYFELIWAKLRIKYPKSCIEKFVVKVEPDKKTKEQIKKQKISAKKGQISKTKNSQEGYLKNFQKYQETYAELFPITEKEAYKEYVINLEKFKNKINRLNQELRELEES